MLRQFESMEGAIWECASHGVKDWLFETSFRAPAHYRHAAVSLAHSAAGTAIPGRP